MCMYMPMCSCVCACMQKPGNNLACPSLRQSTFFSETGFLTGPKLTNWSRLAGQQAPPVSASSTPRLQVFVTTSGFLQVLGMELRSSCCVTSGPSPQSFRLRVRIVCVFPRYSPILYLLNNCLHWIPKLLWNYNVISFWLDPDWCTINNLTHFNTMLTLLKNIKGFPDTEKSKLHKLCMDWYPFSRTEYWILFHAFQYQSICSSVMIEQDGMNGKCEARKQNQLNTLQSSYSESGMDSALHSSRLRSWPESAFSGKQGQRLCNQNDVSRGISTLLFMQKLIELWCN